VGLEPGNGGRTTYSNNSRAYDNNKKPFQVRFTSLSNVICEKSVHYLCGSDSESSSSFVTFAYRNVKTDEHCTTAARNRSLRKRDHCVLIVSRNSQTNEGMCAKEVAVKFTRHVKHQLSVHTRFLEPKNS
jgi:hypothetical protein